MTNQFGADVIARRPLSDPAVVLMVLLWACAAHAQEPGRTWPGHDPSQLSMIYVLDDTGVETSGRLLRFEPDAVVLSVEGAERRFEATQVKRIQKKGDSLKNGAIIGAVVGGVLGGLSAGVADCPGSRSGCPAFRIFMPIFSAAFYGAAGTGIDALVRGRTTLYLASDPPKPGTVSFLRRQAGLRAGISVRFSW